MIECISPNLFATTITAVAFVTFIATIIFWKQKDTNNKTENDEN